MYVCMYLSMHICMHACTYISLVDESAEKDERANKKEIHRVLEIIRYRYSSRLPIDIFINESRKRESNESG